MNTVKHKPYSFAHRLHLAHKLLFPYPEIALFVIGFCFFLLMNNKHPEKQNTKTNYCKPFIIIHKEQDILPDCAEYTFQDKNGYTSVFTDTFGKFHVGDTL